MSRTDADVTRRRELSLAGVTALAIALGFAVIYVRVPRASEPWLPIFHPLFWVFEAGLVLAGCVSLSLPYWPTRWRQRLPRFSRHRVFIPREGIGYLLIMAVLFIGSSLTQSNALMLVFAAMAGPFVVNGSIIYTMLKNVRVRRQTPPRAMAGELFSVQMELTNQTPLVSMWMMVAQDQIRYGEDQWQPTILFTRVPPKVTQVGHYQVRLLKRGRHHFGPVQIMSRFPLGLVERGAFFAEHSEMLIYPRIGRLTPAWKKQLVGASELIETPQPRGGVFDDEYHHLREYRPGDNQRAIHWRSSARRNQLIVREYQQNREHHLLLVIDLYAKGPVVTASDLIEETLSLAATIAAEHRRECRGATLTVLACGQESWKWEARVNAVGLESLFDRLAIIAPGVDTHFAKHFSETAAVVGTNTRVVIVSPRREVEAFANGTSLPNVRTALSSLHWMQVTAAQMSAWVVYPDQRPRTTRPSEPPASLKSTLTSSTSGTSHALVAQTPVGVR
jgi:uncharacterized protein (DUF58 family)